MKVIEFSQNSDGKNVVRIISKSGEELELGLDDFIYLIKTHPDVAYVNVVLSQEMEDCFGVH